MMGIRVWRRRAPEGLGIAVTHLMAHLIVCPLVCILGCASAPKGPAPTPALPAASEVSGAPLPSPPLAATEGAASSPATGASPVGADGTTTDYRDGRLRAHPGPVVSKPGPRGLWTLDLGAKQRALLYVPPTLSPDKPAPLVVVFHGRHGSAELGLGVLRDAADASGFLLLAPEAASDSWDVIGKGAFGPDVANLDRALNQVFARYPVDPNKLAAAGFSDGGSYSLAVALTNGGLFSHVMAYSPGMLRVKSPDGAPLIFVSHGIDDKELPIGSSSRLMVPALRNNGYNVRFEEFRGGHSVPPDLLKASVAWFFKTKREPLPAVRDPDPLPPPAPPAAPSPPPASPAPVSPGASVTPSLPPPLTR